MKKLWGARFNKEMNKTMQFFISSISFDKKLARYDILGSVAHAGMLGKCRIIDKKDSDKIVEELKVILKEIETTEV